MKTITKTYAVYSFDELNEDAKRKAIEEFWDINIYDEWYDFIYEDFKEICKLVGIDVDLKKTYFSGFSSQGDGAAFTADIDLFKLIDGIYNKAWEEHAPKLQTEIRSFTPSQCPIDKRVLDLIKRGFIDISIDVQAQSRYYRSKLKFSSDYSYNECVNYDRIDNELEKLEDWLQDTIDEFTNLLYRLLECSYDYMTSKEAIIESIIANEYEFTKDGKRF